MTMNIKQISGILAGVSLLLGGATPVWSASYGGNWLEVRVVDKQSGSPVGQAAVCLGTRARSDQFGARRASADGTVRFDDLPANSMVLTASRDGYQGKQQGVEPLSGNRVIVLNLASGGGGPVCEAVEGSGEAEAEAGGDDLEIASVRVTADSSSPDGQVLVTVRVSGDANQIRIAESANFADTAWQELQSKNRYTPGQGNGVKRLYVQVRRQVEAKGASIEVLSPVKSVSYRR
jgi:hypothetical protein